MTGQDDDPPVCGSTDTDSGKPCQMRVSDPVERCRYHPDDGDPDVPDGQGAPEGNDNAVGNRGGPGAPDGNYFAVKTGEHMDAKRRLQFLIDEGEEELAQAFANNYVQAIEAGASPEGAMEIATAKAFGRHLERDLIRDQFTRELYHEGEKVADVFDNDRMSAVTSLMREARLLRREEGITANSGQDSGAGGAHGNKDQLIDADAWSDHGQDSDSGAGAGAGTEGGTA